MLGSGGVYASKKRKKPLPKTCTASRPEGAKSNPSKRHRDRLNCELDKLTSLLPYPEDVRARLDKLSVLRLSVGYLKVKSFFNASWKKNGVGWLPEQHRPFGGIGSSVQISGVNFSEGELLLQALNGFVLVVTAEGYVFYASPTIQDYLGFHQSDVLHQSVFELIHTDDRAMFRRQLHFALNPDPFKGEPGTEGLHDENGPGISSNIVNYDPHQIPPENSSFLERSFFCRFRCLLDNSSGFLALNFQGRLKFLYGQNKMSEDGTRIPSQLALFAVATPLQPPSILEIRTKTFIFQTKHKLDFTPMGCCARGRVVLGFSEAELCMRGTGYQFIHAADMMYCAENHTRMIKSGESGLTVFRLLTKHRGWVWVQANARLVYKGGRPDFIIARQRALTNDEGEEHLRQRTLRLPFSFTTGEAVLYENGLNGELFSDKGVRNKKSAASEQKPLDPNSLLGAMMKQDQAIYVSHASVTPQYSLEKAFKPDGSTMNLTTSGWQPQGQCPPIKEENEAFNMISTLEKLINDSDICNTLNNLEDNTELQQWEDALLKMDFSNDLIIELNDILNNDIFSYLEDILFKDTNGMSDSFTQKNDKSVQLDTLRSVQHDSLTHHEQVIPVCLNQNGFATTAKNPSIYSQGSNDMSAAKQGSLNSVLPSTQCQQRSQLLHPTSQESNGLQTNPVMGGSVPDHFLHTSLPHLSSGVHHKSVSDNTQYHFNPLSAYTATTQNDTGISTHKSMPQGRSLSLSNEGQQIMTSSCTQNQSCQMSLGAFPAYPKNRTGSTYPMDMELNTCGGQAQITSDQLMLTGQQDQLTFGHLENSYPECLQQGHSLQNSFERNRSVGQRMGHLPFQMPVNSEHFKKMQNWLHQHQHQSVYNGKPYCTESSASSHTQSVLPSNCSQSQALSALQVNPLQNGTFQSTTIGAGIEQAKHMLQASTQIDSMAVPASTSCLYGNSPLLPYNTISGSTTLNCGTRNLPTDNSPLQASCYYQNNSNELLIEPSVIPQDDISITSLSCHARISPEIQLKEQHFYNCSIPVKQPVQTLEDDGGRLSIPCKSLHNVTAYFMDSDGKTSCCDF